MAADHTTRTRCHVYGRDATRGRLSQCGVETLASLGEGDHILGLKIHGLSFMLGKLEVKLLRQTNRKGKRRRWKTC